MLTEIPSIPSFFYKGERCVCVVNTIEPTDRYLYRASEGQPNRSVATYIVTSSLWQVPPHCKNGGISFNKLQPELISLVCLISVVYSTSNKSVDHSSMSFYFKY
jgi:hypothetical protein